MSLHQLINNKVLYSFRIEILPDADFPIKNLMFLLYIGPSVCWMFCRTKPCGDWVNTKLPEATGLAAPKRKGNLVPLYSQPSYLSHYTANHLTCQSHATSSVRRERQDTSEKGDLLQLKISPSVAQFSNWFDNCDSVNATSIMANHKIYGIHYNIDMKCRKTRELSMDAFNVIGQCRCYLKSYTKFDLAISGGGHFSS